MGAKGGHPYAARRRRLTGEFEAAGIDALLVTGSADVRYLSGFSGEDGALLVARKWALLLADGRFATQARLECPQLERLIGRSSMAEAVREGLRGRGARRVGVPSEHLTLAAMDRLAGQISPRRLRRTHGLVAALRLRKDGRELAAIRRAISIAQRAFRGLIAPGAKALVGRSQAEVAAELDLRMRQLGAERSGFETIVAAGPHAALPHYRPGPTRIRAHQAVLLDWGAVKSGYCSDLTRVVFTGRIPPQIGRIYEVVLRAQAAGIAAVRPGRAVAKVDGAARGVIEAAGYGEAFSHSLGHGIGLSVHEAPAVAASATGRLRAGEVITIEPGIYLPGVGGVRIEDDVRVGEGGATVLSSLPKSLQAMTLR